MASSSGSHNENSREVVWDEEYECTRVDGVLYPTPLSQYNPSSSPPPQEAGASAEQETHEASPSTNLYSVRRKRNLTASRILEIRVFSFQLFHCTNINKNILEMTEVGTENKTYYVLTPYERDGKRKIEAKESPLGERVITPVVGEIYPNLDTKSNLPIEQRLEGRWIIELRERVESMKIERFYSHERVDKTFRSMNDVATFIVYNAIY